MTPTTTRAAAWLNLRREIRHHLPEAWRWTLDEGDDGRDHYATLSRDDGLTISLYCSTYDGKVSSSPVCPPMPGRGPSVTRLREWGLLPYDSSSKSYPGDIGASFNLTAPARTIINGIDRRVIAPYAKLWKAVQDARDKRQAEHDNRRAILGQLFDIMHPGADDAKAKALQELDRGNDSMQVGAHYGGAPCPVSITYRSGGYAEVRGHINNDAALLGLARAIAALNQRPAAPIEGGDNAA